MNLGSKKLPTLVIAAMIAMMIFAISVSANGPVVEPPTVTKNASPTNINVNGSGVNEEATVKITVTGAGEEWATPIPIDVMLIIDRSGSMSWNDPQGKRKTAAKDFVDKMDSTRDQAGVVSWDNNIDFTWPLDNDFPTVKSQIDNVDSSGGTNLNVGLSSAIGVLDANTRTEDSEEVIIFLSDGEGYYTYAGSGGPASNAASKGYVIYSIGLGNNPATGPLTDMATATGGKYYSAPTADNLQAIFDEIYEELTFNTIPHYVDVVEVTQSYIVDEGSFNIAPDNVSTVGGKTVITWNDIATHVGNHDHGLSSNETVTLTFRAKSDQCGQNLPVDVVSGQVSAKVNYKDSNNEDGGSVDIPQAYINVNCPPVADADGPYSVPEGTQITFDASGSYDPDGDTLQYRWDFDDDGVWDTAWSPSPYANHTWCDDHTGTARVEVRDPSGLTDTDTAQVTVYNVAPDVDAGPDQEVTQGDTVYFIGSFTDPGCDTWTYEWNLGDYLNPEVEIGGPAGVAPGVPITADHTYMYPDIYTATLTVTDDDGGVGSDDVNVTVRPKYVDIDSEGVSYVYMLSRFGDVYYTRRANDNWMKYGTGTPPPAGAEYVGVSSDGIRQVYILRDDGKVYYTRRANDNWMQYGTGAPPPAGNYVDLTSDGIRQVYILRDDGKVYYTRRANDNWMQYGTGAPPPAGNYVGIGSDGIRQVYILRDDGRVYYTTSANGNWMQYGTGTPPPASNDYVDIVVDGNRQVYILNKDSTVYYVRRSNDNWMQYGTGSPQPPVGPSSAFGYQAISSEGINQVYILSEDWAVFFTRRVNDAWYRYGTGAQQPPI
ncbi:von Willebrand factor type A domain protein [Candidatus Methanoperedenaceae archaeon GB50]|nr:von Willebrand factor type A domain protein [Candidatus Methanoperedenaceae archaeon GB50]